MTEMMVMTVIVVYDGGDPRITVHAKLIPKPLDSGKFKLCKMNDHIPRKKSGYDCFPKWIDACVDVRVIVVNLHDFFSLTGVKKEP